ncbi:endonuclease domain-containing protein [Roseibium aestuarii]|uniref:Endonuclease domain-containing protein n=1 Tax=Roseibium aestuarii TaxID=2600299 RepID=A0ABW4JWE4_9HYPH
MSSQKTEGGSAVPHHPFPDGQRRNARRLRSGMTDAERLLWSRLRAHRLNGLSFRRQLPLAGFIVDFACAEHRLIIELDGSQHGDALGLQADQARDQRLAAMGWRVCRFWNAEVLGEIDTVCRTILSACGRENPNG